MRIITSLILMTASLNSFSQNHFPDLSPKGKIIQEVGFCTITIQYERPAARGRKVLGGLVPFNELWRTGAGNCTTIKFTEPVTIGKTLIQKGTYSLFTIPSVAEWTIILNKDTALYGTGSYKEEKDACRFKAKAKSIDRYYESFTMDIDVIPNNAVVQLSWEHTQVSIQIETETESRVNKFIDENLLTSKSGDPDEYARAAEYYYYLNEQLDKALALVNVAISLRDDAWYYRQKIDILERQKRYQEAIKCAELANEINQKRKEWDEGTKRQSEAEYRKRVEKFRDKLGEK